MKAKLIIALAAVAMLFTACGKDKDQPLADNTLVYDGVTYQMESYFDAFNQDMGLFFSYSTQKDENGEPLITFDGYHVFRVFLGQEFDLTKKTSNEDSYTELYFNGLFNVDVYVGYDYIGGNLEEEQYESASPFKSGTVKATLSGDILTVEMEGETKNGHTINMKLSAQNNGYGWTE